MSELPNEIDNSSDSNDSHRGDEELEKIRNIEVDKVAIVEEFCDTIKSKSQREQLQSIREFVNINLKNALNRAEKVPPEIEARIWDQETIKKFSTVIEDKFGVCVEWHVVSQIILRKVGIETVFRTGEVPGGPGHTYLDVKIDGKWEIFDPFAERYFADNGRPGPKVFQEGYYTDSNTRTQSSS